MGEHESPLYTRPMCTAAITLDVCPQSTCRAFSPVGKWARVAAARQRPAGDERVIATGRRAGRPGYRGPLVCSSTTGPAPNRPAAFIAVSAAIALPV